MSLNKNIEKYKGVLNLASFDHISKYNFLKSIATKYKIDSNLIQPIKVNGDTDLTIPFENQYLNFRYKDDIMGSLDTRGFDILLCKDDYSSCADEANVMRNKVNKLIKSLEI